MIKDISIDIGVTDNDGFHAGDVCIDADGDLAIICTNFRDTNDGLYVTRVTAVDAWTVPLSSITPGVLRKIPNGSTISIKRNDFEPADANDS